MKRIPIYKVSFFHEVDQFHNDWDVQSTIVVLFPKFFGQQLSGFAR